MRRGIGVQRLKLGEKSQQAFDTKGKELEKEKITEIRKNLELLKVKLEEFAVKYRKEINSNPEFRIKFEIMCSKAGVDILASNNSVWARVLGINDFYYQLAVEIIQYCIISRNKNGGFIYLEDMVSHLESKRKAKNLIGSASNNTIGQADVERAISSLSCLGNSLSVISLESGKKLIVSNPNEVNRDDITVLQALSGFVSGEHCRFTVTELDQSLKWSDERLELALRELLKRGVIWVDCSDITPVYYFIPLCSYLRLE